MDDKKTLIVWEMLNSFLICESTRYEHCPDCHTKCHSTDIVDFSKVEKALELIDLDFEIDLGFDELEITT